MNIKIFFITGLVMREAKKCFIYGAKDYLLSWSNILTTIMSILYFASYGLKYYTLIRVRIEKEKLSDLEFWHSLAEMGNDIEAQKKAYETFYWLNDGYLFIFKI